MSLMQKNVTWVFAGSDSFGAAGVQADIKTTARFDVHAATVITAITAQSPNSCQAVHALPTQQIQDQIEAITAGPTPKSIKIGMIANSETLRLVQAACVRQRVPVILDPVMTSSSGTALTGNLHPKDILALAKDCHTVLTPNVPEAEVLTGIAINSPADFPKVAASLLESGANCAVIKGGHLNNGRYVYDYYADQSGQRFFMRTTRQDVKNLRGTGCTFASALASHIANGLSTDDAVVLAKAYLSQCFMQTAPYQNDTAVIAHETPIRNEAFMPDILPLTGEKLPDLETEYEHSTAHKTGFYVIVDSAEWVKKLAAWGVPTIQLRLKNLGGNELVDEIRTAVNAVGGTQTALYINDYWREAIAAGAFGVHLGQEDLADANLPAIKSAGLRLGLSTHSWYEAAVAQTLKPSYMALGPIFPTTCKSMRFGPQGFEKLTDWVTTWNTPIVAIGGLTLGYAQDLKQTSCTGIAVISDVLAATDPKARVKAWLDALAD